MNRKHQQFMECQKIWRILYEISKERTGLIVSQIGEKTYKNDNVIPLYDIEAIGTLV